MQILIIVTMCVLMCVGVNRPGSYSIPGGIGTKTRGSPYRDSPTAILSGRTKFGSPW
jgi:hypothetical protein